MIATAVNGHMNVSSVAEAPVQSKKPIAIDLFAGAGGFSLAAMRCGMAVKIAVELDRHACETYRTNVKAANGARPLLLETDITTIDWTKTLAKAQISAGSCSLLLGGPPCQGYSAHRINGAGIKDPRNELLLAYFACLTEIKPEVFLLENVPGILWPRHSGYLDQFMRCARAEYEVFEPVVLNARDYGVPQNRKRVFILGYRRGLDISLSWPPRPSHYDPGSKEVREKNRPSWLKAATVFDKPMKSSDPGAVHMNHSSALLEVFRRTPKNGGSRRDSGRTLKCHVDHDGHKDVYGRIDPAVPGPTMTTACINPSKGRFVHPTEDHGITVRHAARFQTFPECFKPSGGLIAAGVQIGNAVPVELGVRLIRPILRALKGV
jgi:DNA (cytosine-5)-methyltransferase 1